MSISVTVNKYFPKNIRYRMRVATITFDTDYPAGGYTLTPSLFGLNGVVAVIPLGQLNGYKLQWDRANNKLMIMMEDLSESTDGPGVDCDVGRNDLDTKTGTVLVIGY